MHAQNDALAREERLAAARKTLSKYQDRIKELKTTAAPAPAERTSLQPPANDERNAETRASNNRESVRGRKDSLSSSSASTATSSSQYSFLNDNPAQNEPLRGEVVDSTHALEAALDFENDAGAGDNLHIAADAVETETSKSDAALDHIDAIPRSSTAAEEELRRINLMYNQICVQLEQKAQEEERLKGRIDGLFAELTDKNEEISMLNSSLSELSSATETGKISAAVADVNSKYAVDSESHIADVMRKLEIAESESKTWHDSCTEWMGKYGSLQASFDEIQRQNLLRENEVSRQLADTQRLLHLREQEHLIGAARHSKDERTATEVADLSAKLASAETHIGALEQERIVMQEAAAQASHDQTTLRAQILDLQSRNARVEAEKYAMYEQMLKQAIVAEQSDAAAATDAEYYSAFEQLSAALHAAEAKLSRVEKEFTELVAAHQNSTLSHVGQSSSSADHTQADRQHAGSFPGSNSRLNTVANFTPALLEDLLRSKFVRMTNENADLRLQLDDKEDQMELLRSECDTVIDYINVYQMQKLKLAEREARVSQLESQIKNQLERSVEYINVADDKLRMLFSNVLQALSYNGAAKAPSFGNPSVLPSMAEPTSGDAAAMQDENQHHTILFNNILNSVKQILDDLHKIKNAETEALNQVHVQRRKYHALDADDKADAANQTKKQAMLPTTADREHSVVETGGDNRLDPVHTPVPLKVDPSLKNRVLSQTSSGNYSRPAIVTGSSMCSIKNAVVAYDGPVISI